MTVCHTLNHSENIFRALFNNVPNLTPRYKVGGIDIALRNLDIELELGTKNGVLLLIRCNLIRKHLIWTVQAITGMI